MGRRYLTFANTKVPIRIRIHANMETAHKDIKEDKTMAKSEQELKELKEEIERLRERLKGLSDDELERVVGGNAANQNSYKFINVTSYEKPNVSLLYVKYDKS